MSKRIRKLLLYQEYITFCLRRENELREQRQNKNGERGSRNAIQDKKAQA